MAIKGAEYAAARIVSTLQTYLPAELDLIDAEMADGITLEDVSNAKYYSYEAEAGSLDESPAITVNVEATEPLMLLSTTNSPGLDRSRHRVMVGVHMKNEGNEADPATMKKRVLRYARAITRILVNKYPTLGGTVLSTTREGEATYISQDQEPGNYVRSAKIPIVVETYEAL